MPLIKNNIENDIEDVVVWAKNNNAVPEDADKPYVLYYAMGDPNDIECDMRIFKATTLLHFAISSSTYMHTPHVNFMKNYILKKVVGITVKLDKLEIPFKAKTGGVAARKCPARLKN